MGDSCEQILDEDHRKPLALKDDTLPFLVEEESFISDHINTYTKLLVDLVNVNVVIEDEDKVLILLSFLSNKRCETFVLTLINGRTSFSYIEETTALVNLELRRNNKEIKSH